MQGPEGCVLGPDDYWHVHYWNPHRDPDNIMELPVMRLPGIYTVNMTVGLEGAIEQDTGVSV